MWDMPKYGRTVNKRQKSNKKRWGFQQYTTLKSKYIHKGKIKTGTLLAQRTLLITLKLIK